MCLARSVSIQKDLNSEAQLLGGSVNPLGRTPRGLMITLLMLIYVLCSIVDFTIDAFYSIRLPDTQINIYGFAFLPFCATQWT